MDGNVSTDQDSNLTQSHNSFNEFDEFGSTDFDSIPAHPNENQQQELITLSKEKIFMPSILKSKNAQPATKDVILIPQILKNPSTLTTNNEAENMRPVILPHFRKMDKNRISRTRSQHGVTNFGLAVFEVF